MTRETPSQFEEFVAQNPLPDQEPYIYLDQEDTCVLAAHPNETWTDIDHIIPESVLEHKFYRDVFTGRERGDLRKLGVNRLTLCRHCHLYVDKSHEGKMNACRNPVTALLSSVDFAIFSYPRPRRHEYRDRFRIQFTDLLTDIDGRLPFQIDSVAGTLSRMRGRHRKWQDKNFDRDFRTMQSLFDSLKVAQDHIAQSLERWRMGDFDLPYDRSRMRSA